MQDNLSEDDISVKFITPAIVKAGRDEAAQIRRQVSFTKGRIIVRGKLVSRGKAKKADFVLYWQHIPIALIEAKKSKFPAAHGMQQALDYPLKDLRDRALVAAERGLIKELWGRVAAELGTALFK